MAKSLSFLTQDAVLVTPEGTFKGSTEVQKYLTWVKQTTKDYKVTDTGIGILAQGNTAVIEHNVAGTYNGMKWEVPAMCIYEFTGDKIQNMRSFRDRLAIAKQATKGWIPKMVVNSVVKGTVKGLH